MEEEKQEKKGISHHPIVVLIVGAILTSILVPIVSYYINDSRQKEMARRAKAVEVFKLATQTERRLNLIRTALENFEKDVVRNSYTFDEYKLEQKGLKEQLRALYAEFDATAWTSYYDISAEASALKILPQEKVEMFNKLIGSYTSNLVKTTHIIDLPWYEFLQARKDMAEKPKVNWTDIKVKMEALRQERAAIIQQMARLFEG